jgi:hypothetical protein
LDKPYILALAAETGFLLFKEQVPLKFEKEISAVQCERKTFRLILLSSPVNFCSTVPLSDVIKIGDFNNCLFKKKEHPSVCGGVFVYPALHHAKLPL